MNGAPLQWLTGLSQRQKQKNTLATQLRRTDSLKSEPADVRAQDAHNRRHGPDRRKSTLSALIFGSRTPRRRGPRRRGDVSVSGVDWHHPQWLGVATLILLLSCADAFLTLTLIDQGAYEINPLMASLIGESALAFTVVKIGLTASGVVLLTLLARMRAFRHIPVSFMLYAVLIGYGLLIAYEMRLLEETWLTP
jgi:hypothetical protein